MNNQLNSGADQDRTDERILTYDVSDEALEAAAGVDDRRAITWFYCTQQYWHCWPE